MTRRALAFGAHPDDVEFLAAGTLVLLHEAGWRVHIATMTPGDLGSATLDREAIATLRREEARRSAAMIKAGSSCLEARDFQVFFGDDLVRRTTALVRAVAPDVVFTHAPDDYLADHEECSRIVRAACFAAPVPNYRTDGDERPTAAIPHLYYCDPVELIDGLGRAVAPDLVVDVTSAMTMKEAMLACHASQREWLLRQHGVDHYVEQMKEWARARGRSAGCEFGEGFRRHHGHAYPRTPLLEEALGARVRSAATDK
jgi:LmbE family N-acetylglucosaminyl deacetylase